ncbi:putative ABC multidrug transporter [Aspergillus heteromorphus CBS 117.55]|uniref:Putative ABC multidrug transporter n=1 Tax=Aspergillus heteromorphus CBS 117.55 TaxID=1448321 RepID=A0A317VQ29_9EURO|nr:putative ABC multidrug transporter [Aspergillus heteromorphus CBS 117.55]PWY75371.1 putative ABC multidrug transporter [Aspergillus heteromorphus CBS 117.55]
MDLDARPAEDGRSAGAVATRNINDAEIEPVSAKNYLRILSYGARDGGIVAIALGLFCAMGSGIALPLMNIVFGKLVGTFTQYFVPGNSVSEQSFKSTVDKDSLYIVYIFVGKFVLTYVSMLSFRIVSLHASAALRLEYTQALFAQPISKLDGIPVGTITNAITGLSNTIQQSVSDRLAVLFQGLALLISAYAIAFSYSWALTLVVSSALLFVVLGYSVTVPLLVKAQQGVDKADDQHASVAAEVFSSVRTVFALGAEASLTRKYVGWTEEAQRRGLGISVVLGFHLALLFFALYCSFALAFWYGLKLYRDGHIASIDIVITVFFSVLIVVGILGNIGNPIIIISKAVSASGGLFAMIDSERVPVDGLRDADVAGQSDITFDNVTFAYPTRPDINVLKGFNARMQKGKTTALVGASGSGKSTVVALIEQWYRLGNGDGSMGNIHVGQHSISDLDTKWWRSRIGLVQQEPFLFDDTIYNNVSFGLIGSEWQNETEEKKMALVVQACKEAYADEFIQRLPLGYSTVVGEGGITLSGGQRQRLAIARSIVKSPPILILDEATSSIDVRGERLVQSALDRVSKDRTTIIIAHRLSTIHRADHIIVMANGMATEEGSHSQLLAMGGAYHSLVHAQQLDPPSELSAGAEDEHDSPKENLQAEEYPVIQFDVVEGEGDGVQPMERKGTGFLKGFVTVFREQSNHWVLYLLTLLGALGSGAGFSLQSWLVARLVQVFQFTGQKLADAANFWSLMFFILALAMGVCYYVVGMASNSISMFVASAYRQEYFLNLLRKPVSYFDSDANSSGTLVSRLSMDPKQLQELFGPTGAFPLISIFNIAGCVAISFAFGWKLAAVAFFAAMPFLFFAAFMRIRYEIMFEAMNAEVYANSSKLVLESIRGFRTVTALTMEDQIIHKYSELLKDQRRKAIRKAWIGTLVYAFSDSVELCAMALTFWYGGQLLASREYGTVAFFVVYIAIIQGGQSAGQFFSFGPNIAQAKASASRILAERADSNETQPETQRKMVPFDPSHGADIEFRGVAFQYPMRATPTFLDLNISIPSGGFVAFVGASGCGKSTIISLLERFYEPTAGTILLGGRDIRSIELPSYRRALSLVPQEPRIFGGTVRDNLLLGLEATGEELEEAMIQACQDAEIHDFIMSLPEGYATELGINAQSSLSGGQKQRLCIARALLRKPRLLLLDEATSSLDSHSEKIVQRAMERLAAKRDITIIAVAHRLATIHKADMILVFGENSTGPGSGILEMGGHHDLLRQKGVYWEMCQAQALDQ